jgi:shikimate kinase
MKVIVIGCEYSGKSTFANNLFEWGKKHDMWFHLDDHFTIPDSSLSKEDRDVMLTLSPQFKERFQRFQAVYHVRIMNIFRDALEVGFYSEDTIYGPIYYGYKPNFLAIRHGRELEKELPKDTILVLLTALPETIANRMEESPHEYQIIKKEDIPMLLEEFEKEFQSSTIHAKIKIDTTKMSPEQVSHEFLEQARQRHLTSADLIRIMSNKN